MAKTSGELEQEFIQTAKEKTGKSLEQWLPAVKKSGLSKPLEISNWLKAEHGLNHLQATLLAGLYLNNGQPVYMNEKALLENQFQKCRDQAPLFESVSEKILARFTDAQLIPKKTYISFTATREFAAINVKPQELRLGLDLGEEPLTNALQKSKLTGPMPRFTHMVVITRIEQFDKKLMEFVEQSYNRSHKK